jgi:hypothetical protein
MENPGFVEYQHPEAPLINFLDPLFAHPNSPGRTNNEADLRMPLRQDYNNRWISELEDSDTRDFFLNYILVETVGVAAEQYIHDPVDISRVLRYDHGAPIDIDGFPLTHHYDKDTDHFIPHGPAPAFIQITEDTPTDHIPKDFILQRWPTGPDERIVLTNPLYQFARSNVPLTEARLLNHPEVFRFNHEFFQHYLLRPNIIATIIKNVPHRKNDCLHDGPNIPDGPQYWRDPPNINGQFSTLHPNFYRACRIDTVYPTEPNVPSPILEASTEIPALWADMSDLELMNLIDNDFINCKTDQERTFLWTSMLPSLLLYDFVFCSICCCRLPEFYFSKTQRLLKRSRRACRHCSANREIKISMITRVLGKLGYFLAKRVCVFCNIFKSKRHFTKGKWNHPRRLGYGRFCIECTPAPKH